MLKYVRRAAMMWWPLGGVLAFVYLASSVFLGRAERQHSLVAFPNKVASLRDKELVDFDPPPLQHHTHRPCVDRVIGMVVARGGGGHC